MKSTAKSVSIVMIIMVFSRLLSFASNQIYITKFGMNNQTDVYSFASSLPNIIFTFFGTALTTLVIPKFAGYIGTGEKKRAFKFVDIVITFSLIVTVVLSVLCVAIAPGILRFTRFKNVETEFATMALRVMFPVMIFYALNYILQGVLQSFGKYNMPAFVSVPSSLVVIGYVFLLGDRFGVRGLVVATFIGLTLQALVLIPPVFTTEYRYHPSFDFRNRDFTDALKLVPPILVGTSAYQISMLVNVALAANFEESVVTITSIMQNLILYSILAFIFSITAVLFPQFTMLAAKNDMEGFKSLVAKVLKSILYFLIPATFGFVAVRHSLIDLIYGWQQVTAENVQLASKMLALYALGITGLGIKEVLDRAFYSLNDTKKPAINGVIIMAVNVLMSFVLTKTVGVLGLPVAYSIASLTGGILLLYLLRKKIGPFGGRSILATSFKLIGASIIMLLLVLTADKLLSGFTSGSPLADKAVKLFVPVGIGLIAYFAATYFLKVDEAVDVLNKIKAKLKLKEGIR